MGLYQVIPDSSTGTSYLNNWEEQVTGNGQSARHHGNDKNNK